MHSGLKRVMTGNFGHASPNRNTILANNFSNGNSLFRLKQKKTNKKEPKKHSEISWKRSAKLRQHKQQDRKPRLKFHDNNVRHSTESLLFSSSPLWHVQANIHSFSFIFFIEKNVRIKFIPFTWPFFKWIILVKSS